METCASQYVFSRKAAFILKLSHTPRTDTCSNERVGQNSAGRHTETIDLADQDVRIASKTKAAPLVIESYEKGYKRIAYRLAIVIFMRHL